jgi:hypothetical protein
MLVYHTTSSEDAMYIWKNGFLDSDNLHESECLVGVWLASRPLAVNDGYEGNTVFSVYLPEKVFSRYEWTEDEGGYRWAVVPADEVNDHGLTRIHDHELAGFSRRELLLSAKLLEASAENETDPEASEGRLKSAANIREAMRFFDEVGWRTISTIAEHDRE